ncbi:hypothetical protein ACSQ67_006861 [Phaseolus vulgaris]
MSASPLITPTCFCYHWTTHVNFSCYWLQLEPIIFHPKEKQSKALLIKQWLKKGKSLQLWNSLNFFITFFHLRKQT